EPDPSGLTHLLAYNNESDHLAKSIEEHCAHAAPPTKSPRVEIADCTAPAAVWPRPQIDASRITCAISPRRAISSSRDPIVLPWTSRCSASSWRTVPTRHGTH